MTTSRQDIDSRWKLYEQLAGIEREMPGLPEFGEERAHPSNRGGSEEEP
jgi:hypothetical protein